MFTQFYVDSIRLATCCLDILVLRPQLREVLSRGHRRHLCMDYFHLFFHKVFNIWNVAAICFPGQPNSETEHKRKLVGKYLWKRKKLNLYRSAVQAVEIVLLSHVFLSLPLTSLILSIAFLSQRLPGLTSFYLSAPRKARRFAIYAPAFSEEMWKWCENQSLDRIFNFNTLQNGHGGSAFQWNFQWNCPMYPLAGHLARP